MYGFDVHLPLLKQVPRMLDDFAGAARKCHIYAEDAYAAMDTGPGPLRNTEAGIINQLTLTHNRIRREVTNYFDAVAVFGIDQSTKPGSVDGSGPL
jgi:hypothetical protein